MAILPRFIRLKDAPVYLGMDRHRFDNEVRKFVTEIPIGIQGIAFDRLDLDVWAEHYKRRYGRPAEHRSKILWDVKKYQDSSSEGKSGTLTKKYTDADFAKAVAQVTSKKLKDI